LRLEHQLGFFAGDESEQAANRSEPGVASAPGTTAVILEGVEEAKDELLADGFHREAVDRLAERIGRITEQ